LNGVGTKAVKALSNSSSAVIATANSLSDFQQGKPKKEDSGKRRNRWHASIEFEPTRRFQGQRIQAGAPSNAGCGITVIEHRPEAGLTTPELPERNFPIAPCLMDLVMEDHGDRRQ